jgi:uncharacterized protein (TIGR00661 family)
VKAKQLKVLICPLDWGLGHASRVIPVIQQFIEMNYLVFIGGSGKSGELLQLTYPDLSFVHIPSPVIRYTRNGNLLFPKLILQIPYMVVSAIREHRLIKKINKTYEFDLIVSDNRYGLFCKDAYCVFITHQISPVLPLLFRWLRLPAFFIIKRIMQQYNECWIPDFEDFHQSLSGKLSHQYKLPSHAYYVGILSRFQIDITKDNLPSHEKYALVIIVSGPEPQLGMFIKLLVDQVQRLHCRTLLITGLNHDYNPQEYRKYNQITIVPHLNIQQFRKVLQDACYIVCRAGYSSIMDLVFLEKSAVLVPTPGQSEQEYLARYLSQKGWFTYVKQCCINLEKIVSQPRKAYSDNLASMKNHHERLPVNQMLYEKCCKHKEATKKKSQINL